MRLSCACQNSAQTPRSWFKWFLTGQAQRGPFTAGAADCAGAWGGAGFFYDWWREIELRGLALLLLTSRLSLLRRPVLLLRPRCRCGIRSGLLGRGWRSVDRNR